MGFLQRIKTRFDNLPKIPFQDKVRYALWKSLFRDLVGKKIVDDTGGLLISRAVKPPRPLPRSTYKTLVSVNGFAWSGSSAVSDLLQEYEGVTSSFAGTLDDPPNVRNALRFEFDLVRGAGGVYALEHAFETANIFERDAAIRIFMVMAYNAYVNVRGFYGDDFISVTRKFVKRLLASEVPSPTGFDYCRHLSSLGTRSANFILGHAPDDRWQYVYYLKQLSAMEYRAIAAEYIHDVLNLVESERVLVMDQGCADGSADVRRFKDYFRSLKMIYIWRDPRDVFAAANEGREREGYIPSQPDRFVEWYMRGIGCFNGVEDEDLMLLRFEDLVMNYEDSVLRIEQFLGIDPSAHVRARTCFVPSMSFDWSVGRWQKYVNQDHIKYIESHLSAYCYLKPYIRPEGPPPDRNLD